MVGCVDNAPCEGDAGLNRDATLVRDMRVGEELLVRIAARTNHMADGRYVIAAAFDLEGDDCDGAVPLMPQEAVRFFGTSSTATDGPAAGPCGPIERDVWFEYAAGNGVVHLDTEGSEFDTVLAVYDALAGGGGGGACPPDSGSLLACDDDSGADGASRLALPVAPGQSILIQVGGADGASGFGRLNFYFEYVHCPCNLDDDDAHVNVLDLLAYLDRWFAATDEAEFDGEAGITAFDLLSFLDCWFPASAGERCSE